MTPPAIPKTKSKKSRTPPTVSQLRKQIDTNWQGQEGVAWVRWVVEGLWGCGLEVVSANNDDGVDAIILLKRRRSLQRYAGPTGDLIFVQIKTGYVSSVPQTDYSISFDADKMARWRLRWAAYPGPALMINVVPRRLTKKEPQAFWADLKNFAAGDENKVHFRIAHRFDFSAKSDFYNLCWRWAEFRQLPTIRADSTLSLFQDKNLRETARDYFKSWKREALLVPKQFIASITWQGWDHITRYSRPTLTKQQSLQLLPVAKQMLRAQTGLELRPVTQWKFVPQKGQTRRQRYEVVTARVTFFERHEAIVRVVLLRTELITHGVLKYESTVFYSVYEVARRRKSP
jgi:hypothetical protein